MDQNKKKALVKWIDALSESRVNSFEDLQDGSIIASVLLSLYIAAASAPIHAFLELLFTSTLRKQPAAYSECCEGGENCLQGENGLDTPQKRMHAIKKYVEDFYHQPIDERKVIDFHILLDGHVSKEEFDMEMGKLLLALLGCVVQDKWREKFIQPAFNMEECYQFELKEMIETVLFNNEMETEITADYLRDVLKRKTVADGNASPQVVRAMKGENPQRPSGADAPVFAMYTNSPQHANTSASGINIRDISSPLRIMSLSSPVTPLSALMHSPQLAQKILTRESDKRRESEAMLRQKIQEFKRLEVAMQNEQHLRSELELDLRERSAKIEEKDARVRDLEKQLSEVRWMRDQLDELELLKTEKETLSQENVKLQSRLTKYQDLKDHSDVLERENREIHAEVQKAREEMKLLDAVKKSCEDYRVRCHKQQLELSEHEAMLQHRIQEIGQLTQSLEETRNMYQVSQSQCNTLKREKEELEEMIGSTHGDMGVGLEGAVYAGEPMSIVTDKKLSELQAQYDHIKETWMDPVRYQTVLKDLELEKEAKSTYERHYIEMKQKIMSSEDEVELLKNKLQQQEMAIAQLESSLQTSKTTELEAQTQVSELESSNDGLKKSQVELKDQKAKLEKKVQDLEKELSGMQMELDLNKKELELHVSASESRRLTIMQLDNEKQEKQQAEQRLNSELQSWKVKTEELQDLLKCQKEETLKSEENLNTKLANLQNDLDQIQAELKNEQYDKKMGEKTLTDKIKSLEETNEELTEKFNTEKNNLNNKITDLEGEVESHKTASEEQIQALKSVTKEYEAYKSATKEKEESISCDLKVLQKDKKEVDLELHRLKCEIKSLSQSYEEKLKKLQTKYTDSEHTQKKQIESCKSKLEESLMTQKSLKEELAECKQIIQEQKLEIEKLNKVIVEFKNDNSQLGESFEKSKMTLIEYEYELKTCKEKLANEREQFHVLQKEKDEIINSLQFQCESTVEQYKKDRTQLLEQISDLENTIDSEKRNLSEVKFSLEKTLGEKENSFLSEIKLLQHEKKELISSHESYVKELKTTSEELNKSLKEKVSLLQRKVEEVESERFELECAKKEQSARIQTMSEQLQNYEKKNNLLLSDLNEARLSLKSSIDLKIKEVNELENNISDMKNEFETENSQMEMAMNEQKQAYESRITCLEQELKRTEMESSKVREELETERNGAERKLQLTLSESEKLMQKCEALECETKHKTSEIERLRSEFKECNIKSAQLEKLTEDLEQKMKRLGQSRADMECQFTEFKQESENFKLELKDKIESLLTEKSQTEQSFDEYKIRMEASLCEMREKMTETESYWQSQCEQLAEEYSRDAQEQKEETRVQLQEMENNYESKLQSLSDEKEQQLSTRSEAHRETVSELEKAVEACKMEIQNLLQEKESKTSAFERQLNDATSMVVKYKDDCASLSGETEILKAKCKKLEEEKLEKIEILIGEYETQIADLRTTHEETLKTMQEEHDQRVHKLQSDLDEQRVNYQKMISDMEEKLGGETFDLRERLSQMKCQYDTLIESKEKDTKHRLSELETKLKSLERDNASLQESLTNEKADNTQKQSSLKELHNKNIELETFIEKAKTEHMEIEKQLAASIGNVSRLESELKSTKDELMVTGESIMKEKGEREEAERQLEYTRDRNDTLTAELSSQQQQLAAVEEEKRMLEVEAAKNKTVIEEVKQQAEKDLRFREIEKNELERQLQSSQKCYEAVQKAQTELENQIERMGQDRLQLENRNRELEHRIYNYLEREKKMMEDNQHQIDTAGELNASLRKQLDEKSQEIREINDKFNKEIEVTHAQFIQMKAALENNLKTVTEDKTALEIQIASLEPIQQKLKETEAERKKLQDVNDKYNIHYNKKKEVIAQLTEELKVKTQELEGYKHIEDKLVKEVAPLRERLEAETLKTKSLTAKVRSLEAQNDLADRKIRDLTQKLEKDSAQFFGDSSDFMKIMKARENSNDASFMDNHPGTIPMDDSLFEAPRNSVSDNTLTPGRESRTRKRLSKSVSSTLMNKENRNDVNADTVSIGSASSLAYRLRSRESAVSLNRSIASFDSCKSNASVPRGTGRVFHCEDEPMEFEFGRLGELQRRNTLCPAHLKTSYPVETQTYQPNKFREDALRESTMGDKTILQAETGSGRKRKKTLDSDSSGGESSDSSKNKLAKTGCVYQKPGPPTPANSRRSSKGSKSPGSRNSTGRLSKSPKTPVHVRGKRTPKLTPRHTPKRSGMEVDGTGSAKKFGKRASVAFNVGFSPVSMQKSSRLTRQQAFIQKQPPASGQMAPPKRKPLGIRNFLQTGL